jgi:hypothetical protein
MLPFTPLDGAVVTFDLKQQKAIIIIIINYF